jgi:hypothetical protein
MITIALSAEGFALTIQSPKGLVHTVQVPNSVAGLKIINTLLHAQAAAQSEHDKFIGTRASPTEEMVRHWLRDNKPKAPAQSASGPAKQRETNPAFADITFEL